MAESHILLQLPYEVAALVEASPSPSMEIRFDQLSDGSALPPPGGEMATFSVDDRAFRAKLMSLPTVVETHKSVDGTVYFKTGHVGQVLVVATDEADLPAGTELRDGVTPPCAAIRERKWRRRAARDRKEIEQVIMELEVIMKGSLPKPEYELVEEETEVRRDIHRRLHPPTTLFHRRRRAQTRAPRDNPPGHRPQRSIGRCARHAIPLRQQPQRAPESVLCAAPTGLRKPYPPPGAGATLR